MNTSKQTQIAQTLFEAMQTNDDNQWSALLSDNYVGNYPGLTGANKAMAQTFNSVFSVAFPDLKFNIKNIFEVGNRFYSFDLGDHQRVGASSDKQLARQTHVAARFGEGDSDIINIQDRRSLDVLHILRRQRRGRESAALLVDAFVVRELTIVPYATEDFNTFNAFDVHYHAAIIK